MRGVSLNCFFICGIILLFVFGCQTQNEEKSEAQLREKAEKLAQEFLIIDTHIDVPFRLYRNMVDISKRTEKGEFDYVRAGEGGLNAAFMSIYIPASYQKKGGAKAIADTLIDIVESMERKWPEKFVTAKSVADVTKNFGSGKVILPLGMENGAGIEGDIENLEYFYNRGIRYITLAHAEYNRISDSSYDEDRKWHGLSPFGIEVVKEMNRLGIMVDVSHITDESFYDVMEVTKAPVIASHSSCRHFTPGFERNMSDELVQRLAENNGVIQISFGSYFLSKEYEQKASKMRKHIEHYLKDHHLSYGDSLARDYINNYRNENPLDPGEIGDIVDHIDHVVQLVGIDHVGFGSDFDGVRALPRGMEDVSKYPNLIFELLKRGYSEEDIEKICSKNLLRVWSEVERISNELK